ncbi:MAG: hypothetical protein L7F77_14605, partial [Candidatus Magnetominusculus sp. LBB02]|nr:hypothetical protein [Candidatus Magnetominusculus sp. LBB02]
MAGAAIWAIGGSRYVLLLSIFLKVLLILSLLLIPGFLLLKLVKKGYFSNNMAFLLAAPASIFVYGLIFIPLYSVHSHFIWYLIFNSAYIISVIYVAYMKMIIPEILNISPTLKYGLMMAVLSSVIALCFLSVNINNPEKEMA